MNHDQTPRMSQHARERCRQMGLSTKVAKAIFRAPGVVRPADNGNQTEWPNFMVTSDLHPEYALVVADHPTGPVVVTVVFRVIETYQRQGTTYTTTREN